MLTLPRLKRKPWYKLLQVLYYMCILLSIVILFSCINRFGKDWHGRKLPATKQEALNDPRFYLVSDEDKRDVLSLLDKEFSSLHYKDQKLVIAHINTGKLMDKPIQSTYVYAPYYSWNKKRCLLYFIVGSLFCIGLFKTIRHVIYFIVLGTFFPADQSISSKRKGR